MSLVLVSAASASTGLFDFEGLTPGEIIGQDGWSGQVTDGIQPTGTVQTGVGVNTTQVLRSTTQVVSFTRTEETLSYDPTSTSATLQFDVLNDDLIDGLPPEPGFEPRAAFFVDAPGNFSPFIGIFNGNFEYRADANGGPVQSTPISAAGDRDDWYRIRLDMNLAAATARYFVTNLTDGTPEQELFVGETLNIARAADADGWSRLRLRADRPAVDSLRLFDNLVFEIEDTGVTGDFNGDDFVNAGDYPVLRDTNAPSSDFDLWRENFGSGPLAVVQTAEIPEPTGLFLIGVGAAAAFGRRRR